MKLISYQTLLKQGMPHPETNTDKYVAYLETNRDRLYRKDIQVAPFSYLSFREQIQPISLKVMQEMLREKNVISKVEKRGRNLAMSFMRQIRGSQRSNGRE